MSLVMLDLLLDVMSDRMKHPMLHSKPHLTPFSWQQWIQPSFLRAIGHSVKR
jgi:hypothetical protein